MVMNEAIRSFPILERCGPLNPMLQRMTRVIAGKPDDPSPIVALVIPFEERPLLDAALDAVWCRFIKKRSIDNPATVKPLVLDVMKLIEGTEWPEVQELLLGARFQPYTVLVIDRDPGELYTERKMEQALRFTINQTFNWPDPIKRIDSLKRDYFLHAVATMDARVGDEITRSETARNLLKTNFANPDRGVNLCEITHFASGYLNHFSHFKPSKSAVDVLVHFTKHVLDTARVSTPPMGEEIPNTDNATKVA